MDEDRLAGLGDGQVGQPVVGREVSDRDGRGLRERPLRRHVGEQLTVGHRHRRDLAGQQSHHPVARGKVGDVGPDLKHDAGALGAHVRLAGIHVERDEGVAEVEARRGRFHPHLPRRQRNPRGGMRLGHQVLQRATPGHAQPPR